MEELQDKIKSILADTFVLYMKVHGYHWNVIGSDFPQYHSFFGDLYEELHGAVDEIADRVRCPAIPHGGRVLDSITPDDDRVTVNLCFRRDKSAILPGDREQYAHGLRGRGLHLG